MKNIVLFLVVIFIHNLPAQGQIITTIAGTGTGGLHGDGGPAVSCTLEFPYSTAVDSAGNLYIADLGNDCVRKIDKATGIINTIAGTSVAGFSGDGGPATAAQLSGPVDVAVDRNGNVFIADNYNHRIRKVDLSGTINTIAGTGFNGYGGDGGPATAAAVYSPHGVAFDNSGNLLICDNLNNRIRKIDAGGIITTIAGTGMPGHSGDGGPATLSTMSQPYGITVDISGNIYIADRANYIRKISPAGIITSIAGTGVAGYNGDGIAATTAQLNQPYGVAVDVDGGIYIADVSNSRIRKIEWSGVISTVAGAGVIGYSGDNGPATAARIDPTGITVDKTGNLYIADFSNFRIRYIKNTVGVSTVTSTVETLEVSPNPSSGAFSVKLSETTGSEMIDFTITDISGRPAVAFKGNTNETISLDLHLPSGFYILSAVTNQAIARRQIIISR
jgi:sugar lactone lactonase YvrE